MAALTDAFRDAIGPDIGMLTVRSHSLMLLRDTPRSSEPITSAVPNVRSASRKSVVASASSAIVCKLKCFRYDRVFEMLETRDTGTCTRAPADARMAPGETDAARRSGIINPWPPAACNVRAMAPRLCGSTTPSNTANNGCSPIASAARIKSSTCT